MLLAKRKLETTEILISKDLIDSYVSHDKFNPVKNVLRDDNEMKKEIKNTCFAHLLLSFKGKANNQEFWMGTSTGRLRDTFWGIPRDVGHTCSLNSTQKRIKLTFTGSSRLCSEF